MKISIIVGTRPEIIKMSPIIRECKCLNLDFFILHTGQHYSHNMDGVFFDQLELPKPKHNLNIGSGSHCQQTGKILIEIEKIFEIEKPDIVLVQGDTNSVLSAALAASKLDIKIGHVEAGLRSFDRRMPEEINRVITDHISDYLFAPTNKARKNLINEGIDTKKIFVTGNTIVDAVNQNLELSKKQEDILDKNSLESNKYFLVTTHRQENVDDKNNFQGIIKGLEKISKKHKLPVVYPIHPRSRKKLNEFNIDYKKIKIIEPLDLLAFLQLESNAKLILTDSGGIQEESCIIGKPCVTLRENTERPETLEVGANILAGTCPDKITETVSIMINKKKNWNNVFGNGNSAKMIIKILEDLI